MNNQSTMCGWCYDDEAKFCICMAGLGPVLTPLGNPWTSKEQAEADAMMAARETKKS